MAVFQRKHAVMMQAGSAAPDHDIAVLQRYSTVSVRPGVAAEQENRRQAERHRHDGRAEITLVLVLMQSEPGAGLVPVHEACIGLEARVAGGSRSGSGQFEKFRRHRWPRPAVQGIAGIVAISTTI